jgi:hypothetical protein
MSGRKETPRGAIRVQIPGYAWDAAMEHSLIADNPGWWERREYDGGREKHVVHVALLDPERARMVGHALEGQSKMTRDHHERWALTRAALRIEADLAVMGQEEPYARP